MMNGEILKRLKELEARAAKATPGPWKLQTHVVEPQGSSQVIRCDDRIDFWNDESCANAKFIANAREDVPWLCQTIRRLVAQNAAMREALEEIVRTEPDEKPDGTVLGHLVHDAYEMCEIANAALKYDAGRDFLDRLRKLESAARLALQALTEGMADVPAERDKRCAELRVKAKRALREALGFALEEENDGDF